jgi:DNA end-binding protein Ku
VVIVAQAVWTGALSFGLVNIPVKLYSATVPKNVGFHQYDAQTGRRIRYRRVAAGSGPERAARSEEGHQHEEPAERADPAAAIPVHLERAGELRAEPEVQWNDVVKGVEVEPGKVVTVTPEELGSLAPERTRELEVEQFVPLAEIDPVYFDKSYYIAPMNAGAERPYRLLYRAMQTGAVVAVGRFVMRTREYLAVVRPAEDLLMLETLFYADEVRSPKEIWRPPVEEPPERELHVAQQFIHALAGSWEPDRHRDEHRERLLDLLRSKSVDAHIVPELETEETTPPVIDLIEALKASVEAAKQARAG